jgi:hypothetical protein
MVEFGADTQAEAIAKAKALPGNVITDKSLISRLWTIRETGASATSLNLRGEGVDPVVGWEDAAVDPMRLGDYLREFQALIDRMGYRTSLYAGWRRLHPSTALRTPGLAQWPLPHRGLAPVAKYGARFRRAQRQPGGPGFDHLRAELVQAFREFKRSGSAEPHEPNADRPRRAEDLRLGPRCKPALSTRFKVEREVGNGCASNGALHGQVPLGQRRRHVPVTAPRRKSAARCGRAIARRCCVAK